MANRNVSFNNEDDNIYPIPYPSFKYIIYQSLDNGEDFDIELNGPGVYMLINGHIGTVGVGIALIVALGGSYPIKVMWLSTDTIPFTYSGTGWTLKIHTTNLMRFTVLKIGNTD